MEFKMTSMEAFSEYFGFTDEEVDVLYEKYTHLCKKLQVPRNGLQNWYDGYFTVSGRSGKNSMRSALRESLGKRKDTPDKSWVWESVIIKTQKNIIVK